MRLSALKKNKLFALALKCCLMLILIELTCRGIALTQTKLSFYINNWQTHRFMQATDPETGAGLIKPHVRYKQMSPDGDFVEIRSDAEGYRNDFDYAGEKIVALGDSFVVAPYTASEKTWPALLSRQTKNRVYAIGAGNTGPHQQLALLDRFFSARRSKPETVLWMLSPNTDIKDEFEFVVLGKKDAPQRRKPTEIISYFAMEESYTVRVLSALWRMEKAKNKYNVAMPTGKRHVIWGKSMDFFYSDNPIDKQDAVYARGLESIKNAIIKMKTYLGDKNRLVIVYAATKSSSFIDLLSKEFGVKSSQVMSFDDELESFCNNNKVEFLNLREAFKRETNKKRRLFFYHDGHYNDEGNALAAEEICNYLKTNPSPRFKTENK